jgi:hypothetical protein
LSFSGFFYKKSFEKKIKGKASEEFKNSNFEFDVGISNMYVFLIIVFILIGTASAIYVLSDNYSVFSLMLIGLVVLSLLFFYAAVLNTFSPSFNLKKITSLTAEELEKNEWGKKMDIPIELFFSKSESFNESTDHVKSLINLNEQDKNSIAVVRIEGQLKNMSATADSYLLESIFLGALAFSGFLSIVSERVADGGSYKKFFSELTVIFNNIVNLDFFQLKEVLLSVSSGDNLFALISIEALLCSIFFILVIALRLKLKSYLEKIDILVRLGTLYHAKEEEISNLLLQVKEVSSRSKLEGRLSQLSQNLRICINDSEKLVKQTIPVVNIMVTLRNIGVAMFYLLLITSGMLFSYYFSFLIFVLAILTFFIKELRSFFDSKKLNKILANYKFGEHK